MGIDRYWTSGKFLGMVVVPFALAPSRKVVYTEVQFWRDGKMLEGLHRPADRLWPVWKSRLEKPRLRVSAFRLALTKDMVSRPLINSFEQQSLRDLFHQASARCPAQGSPIWAADAHSMRRAAGRDVPLNAFGKAILGGSVWTRIHPDRCQPVCCPDWAKKHPGFAPSLSAAARRGVEEQDSFCWSDAFPRSVIARSVGSHQKLLTLPPRIQDLGEEGTPEKRDMPLLSTASSGPRELPH